MIISLFYWPLIKRIFISISALPDQTLLSDRHLRARYFSVADFDSVVNHRKLYNVQRIHKQTFFSIYQCFENMCGENFFYCLTELTTTPGGDTLGISEWGCAAGTLEPLTYTRASSAEFCYPILE